MRVVAAREELRLGKAIICPVATSTGRARRDISPCRAYVPGRSGQWGRPSSTLLEDQRQGGEGVSCPAGGRSRIGVATGQGHHLSGCMTTG